MSAQMPQLPPSAQTPYEACLYGSITGSEPFQAVFDRLVLRSDSGATPSHIRELIFRPSTTNLMGGMSMYVGGDDHPVLVCRRDLLNTSAPWTIATRGRPEPARQHPNAIVRPAIYAKAQGDVQGFASVIGFGQLQSENHKRGLTFIKGNVTISIYQLDALNPETAKWEKPQQESTWMIEAKTPPTIGLLTSSIEALLEVRDLLKGLVDLNRENIHGHI